MNPATHALIVIDVQNDFCPGGALAVVGGDEIVAPINALMEQFPVVVLTQDWHPKGHSSFASSHDGAAPFSAVQMSYGEQTLWPDHCIQGTEGAAFHPALRTDADLIIRKGMNPAIDSYSAFFENDRTTPTGLEGYLRTRGITTLIDNTWATPLRLQPLALGVDISIQALTKYVAGHSDAMMGSATFTKARALLTLMALPEPSIPTTRRPSSSWRRRRGTRVGGSTCGMVMHGVPLIER